MGRPTDNPKNTSIKFKADDETVRKLKECSEILNVSRAEVLRQGVHRMYDDLKKMKGSGSPLVKATATSSTANAKRQIAA